ncbi:MAG: peptidylprolyl isomerase [Promethearchaeota archaeon]|nr:MAG: peptidylprolyl isomerase [Candidatus Lokiarchaeota archaeon]
MAIKKGEIIKVEYEGFLKDGTIFDSTERNNGIPLKFKVGDGSIIKGFDEAVVGKKVGEEFTIKLEPQDAYGDYQEELIRKLPKSLFPKDQDPKPGMAVQVVDQNGRNLIALIKAIEEKDVIIDLNHPLAGKTLNFKIKIIETDCKPNSPDK